MGGRRKTGRYKMPNPPVNVVFLCQSFPYPPKSGKALRESGILEVLQKLYPVQVITLLNPGESRPSGLSASFHFVERERGPLLRRLFNPLFPYVTNGYSYKLERKLRDIFNPGSVLWISRLALSQYISVAKKIGYRVILDEHNVEADLYHAAVVSSGKWREWPLAWQLRRWEKKACDLADTVVVTSERDKSLIGKMCPTAVPRVVPNCLPNFAEPVTTVSEAKRPSLLFVGTLNYAPNVEGLQWFIREVLPRLEPLELSFVVAGGNPSAELVSQLEACGISVFANVPDLTPLYTKADICIVPLLSGGGTRLKILEALAHGRAVVSTAKGCEGLELAHEENILIGNTPQEFADCLKKLALQPSLRAALAAAGRSVVKNSYTWPRQENALREICDGHT